MLKVRNYFVSLLLLLFLSTSFAAGLERKDAVKDQTTTTGTATFTLANLAPAGARSISTHTSGSTVRYRAINSDGSEWEDGEGVVTNTAGTWTLTRVNVFASSNSNALTSFSAGTKSVLTIPTAKDFDVPDWATGSSVASATTINLDAATGGIVHVTGTTTIGTVTLSRGPRLVVFDGTLTLTHNATTNNLPGAANIVVNAGDRMMYVSDGTTVYGFLYGDASDVATTNNATQTLTNKVIDAASSSVDGSVGNYTVALPGTALVLFAASSQSYLLFDTQTAGLNQKFGRITWDTVGAMRFEKVNDAFNSVTTLLSLDNPGNLQPGTDNTQTLGSSSFRWSTVYAGTGTINTSDAREKTSVRKLSADEVASAIELSHEIGGFRWLAEVAKDGDLAKTQVGMTVQRAIEILRKHGLDPTAYGFIVHDQLDNGGDRYGFRPDQLALFIEAGLTARLDRLEAANDARYAKRRAK